MNIEGALTFCSTEPKEDISASAKFNPMLSGDRSIFILSVMSKQERKSVSSPDRTPFGLFSFPS
jgi:hypothetical protein